MYKNMDHKKYEEVLKIARELLPKFLYSVYQEYYSENYEFTSENRQKFINMLGNIEGFPFTGDNLRRFLTFCKNIEINDSDKIAETCKNSYEIYSTIFDGFHQYHNREEN